MVVLVVEDEAIIGLMLALELRIAGYRVSGPASTVQAALELAAGDPPDIAFVDINLEGQEEGLNLARALRDQHGTTCIFVTAWPVVASTAKDAAIGVIEKPYLSLTVVQAAAYAAAVRAGTQLPSPPLGLALLQ